MYWNINKISHSSILPLSADEYVDAEENGFHKEEEEERKRRESMTFLLVSAGLKNLVQKISHILRI